MEAFFEVHTTTEPRPPFALITGINNRKFKSDSGFVKDGASSKKDFSLDASVFDPVGIAFSPFFQIK